MAVQSRSAASSTEPRQPPVLQPGRPANSAVSPSAPGASVQDEHPTSEEAVKTGEVVEELDGRGSGGVVSEEDSRIDASEDDTRQASQARRRRLLRQCERALLLEFDALAIPDWPDDRDMAFARQRRDIWVFGTMLTAIVFLSGIPGFIPAWIAGSAFGATVVLLLAGAPPLRRLYRQSPSYLDLVIRRRQRLLYARRHVAHLEGIEGLAWQCAMMAEYNPALQSSRFGSLVRLSEQRKLVPQMRQREHMRLYLGFMLEAEKAYKRLQLAYFECHQQSIDQGTDAPR